MWIHSTAFLLSGLIWFVLVIPLQILRISHVFDVCGLPASKRASVLCCIGAMAGWRRVQKLLREELKRNERIHSVLSLMSDRAVLWSGSGSSSGSLVRRTLLKLYHHTLVLSLVLTRLSFCSVVDQNCANAVSCVAGCLYDTTRPPISAQLGSAQG